MSMVIVPNELARKIDSALDLAFLGAPEAAVDRAYFYNELLCFYDEHGYVPEFSLTRKATDVSREATDEA